MIVPIIVTALLAIFLNRTVKGRHLLAVGGNSNAADLSGISVSRTIMLAHGLSGLIAAIAGVLAVAQLGSAQPTIGSDWLIISFAAPIIGGASLLADRSITGTVIAVVLIGLIQNAMVLLAVDPYWVTFLLGSLILAAVFDQPHSHGTHGEVTIVSHSKTSPSRSPRWSSMTPPSRWWVPNSRVDGREWRRQVDPDQDHHRGVPGR